MENLKVNTPKKDEKENLNQNSTYHQQGIKSFTPPPPGIQPVTGPLKPNIIQRMQALPENERPAYFQPNLIQRMQALPEEERPTLLQPNIIQRIRREQPQRMVLNNVSDKKEANKIGEKTIQASSNKTVTVERTTEKTSDENEVDPSIIKTEDVKYELIAHGLAYQKTIPKDGNMLLYRWGYSRDWKETINDENSSLFAGLILPQEGKTLSPVIAFKGTLEGKDFMADGDPYAVGYTTFMLNRSKILSSLLNHSKVAGRKVDVVGHSLGGALAKHCAVEFPDRIGRGCYF